jgi:hypothetical protein
MDNNTAKIEPKVCTLTPITACGVNDIQNLVCNLIREEATSYKQWLKSIAYSDIQKLTVWTPVQTKKKKKNKRFSKDNKIK